MRGEQKMSRRLNVLAAIPDSDWDLYHAALKQAFAKAGLEVNLAQKISPAEVDYIVYTPSGWISDFSPFSRTKAVLSLWAGVERIIGNTSLTQPLARMVDPALREGMREWVAGHVLRHHLGLDRDICRKDQAWQPHIPPLARNRQVGVLGLGVLGAACAEALAGLGFQVSGWSRRPKNLAGAATFSGDAGLGEVLRRAEILVLLLPLTPQTKNILDAAALALLPKGAVVINPGRGALIDDEALLAALDRGQLSHATLDVFRTEPLPPAHKFWAHPGITVTPHIASATRPDSAAGVIAENIRRGEAGQPFLHLVDRRAGY